MRVVAESAFYEGSGNLDRVAMMHNERTDDDRDLA
jgi:hypothetical protein